MQRQRQSQGGLRAGRTHLLPGLLAIRITAIGVGRALSQQGLHVASSPFIDQPRARALIQNSPFAQAEKLLLLLVSFLGSPQQALTCEREWEF